MNDTAAVDATAYPLPEWHYAFGEPTVRGVLRSSADDFVVDEELGYGPDGDGEHLLLHVRKRDTNTEWLARTLAQYAGVKPVDVGFAGLKDRYAVTTQWFSLHLPDGREPDWLAFACEGVEVLAVHRHRRKLRRGALQGNRFVIVVRQLAGDLGALESRLACVAQRGVPNYFGAQRFGIGGGNLAQAAAMFASRQRQVRDRHKRGLYLSAARSLLFNEVLSARVAAGNWDQVLPGEVLMLEGSQSNFVCDRPDAVVAERASRGELHPTGPMWGRGRPLPAGEALALETSVLEPYAEWRGGLEHVGLDQERRALRLKVDALQWTLDASARTLTLSFALPAGAYATTVLREVVAVDGAEQD